MAYDVSIFVGKFKRPMSRTYSNLSCFYGNYATASVNIEGKSKWGLIDKGGNEVIPPMYDYAIYKGEDVVYVNNGLNCSTFRKKTVTKNRTIGLWEENYIMGKWGIVNLKNELIVPFTYSRLNPFGDGYISASLGKKAGLITAYGERITPFKYDLILPIRRDYEIYFALIKPSGSGVIDSKGNFVLEPIYSGIGVNCSNDEDGWIVVNKGNETFYIDKQWKRCCL